MVDYTLGSPAITPTIELPVSWAITWHSETPFPVSVLPPAGTTSIELRVVDPSGGELIATPISPTVTWGLFTDGGFDSLISTEVRVFSGGLFTSGVSGGDSGWRAANDEHIDTPVVVTGEAHGDEVGFLTAANIVGVIQTPVQVAWTLDLFEIYGSPLITTPLVVSHANDMPLKDTRKSPALVLFDGTNYLARIADDSDLDGQDEFSCAIIFDPELVEPGQDCVVLAKNDETGTQAGWKVEWAASTGFVTVTVFNEAAGTNSVSRTTTTAIRYRSILVWTWDSTGAPDLQLYVAQASSQGSQTNTGSPTTMASNTEPLSVGAHEIGSTPTDFMTGAVYLVAFWDDVLTPSEAASIDAHGSLPTALVDANLISYWNPLDNESNQANDYFYRWLDSESGASRLLRGYFTTGDIPRIIPGDDPLAPFILRNDWDTDFFDQSDVRTQNLNSDRDLSSDLPSRRLYNVTKTNPNISDGNNWRTRAGDLTLVCFLHKGGTENDVLVAETYGLEIRYDRPSTELTVVVGDANPSVLFTFPKVPGFGDGQTVVAAFKYNAVEEKVVAIINGTKVYGATSADTQFTTKTGVEFADEIDYIAVKAIPACLSDGQVEEVIRGFLGEGYSFTYGLEAIHDVDNRFIPQDASDPTDLCNIQAFGQNTVARYTGTGVEPPPLPAAVAFDRIAQRAMTLPSVIYGSNDLLDLLYVDEPYPVQEGGGIDGTGTVSVIFTDPLPTIVSVTANLAHQVTAIANAGPTDAGTVISWWEVELISGSVESVVQFDYNGANSFSVNRDHTDTFPIPLGINLDEKRIRFVIQAVSDASQIWRSLWVRMEGEEFDNGVVEQIISPSPSTPSPPTVTDLEVAISQSTLVLRRGEEVAGVSFSVSAESRYKLTRAFIDSDRDRGPEFELMSVLEDFTTLGDDFRRYRVAAGDIGFLDRLAVKFFGPGSESLWWAIAYANSVLDPETLQVGDELLIPSRATVREFLARRPVSTG